MLEAAGGNVPPGSPDQSGEVTELLGRLGAKQSLSYTNLTFKFSLSTPFKGAHSRKTRNYLAIITRLL